MTAGEALELARARLAALANPATREAMQRYFKQPVRALGVPAPQIRLLTRELYPEVKRWPPAARNRFCSALLRGGVFEEGSLAIYLYQRFTGSCRGCEFRLFERWIDRWVDNWAWCDGIACWLVADSLANEPSLLAEIPGWTGSPNRWKRRAAAVSLVPAARRGLHIGLILDVAGRLRGDGDDMVRKGAGWLLKDAYPAQPAKVVALLSRSRPPFPRPVVRIAAEKMAAPDRRAVLAV